MNTIIAYGCIAVLLLLASLLIYVFIQSIAIILDDTYYIYFKQSNGDKVVVHFTKDSANLAEIGRVISEGRTEEFYILHRGQEFKLNKP